MILALKNPCRYASCDANPAPGKPHEHDAAIMASAKNSTLRRRRKITKQEGNRSAGSARKETPTCPLVEDDVDALSTAVEREVGVAEELRVAL